MWPTTLIAMIATIQATGNAPQSLDGRTMEYHVTKANGVFASYAGQEFYTSFNGNSYTDQDGNGAISDGGTYTYRLVGPNQGEVTYHPNMGDWQGGDYTESLYFKTPSRGRAEGTPATGQGEYSGAFYVTS
jgi:hypothetical protein